jgi:hypothetical protein
MSSTYIAFSVMDIFNFDGVIYDYISIAKICRGLSACCGPFHLTRCGLDRLKDTIYCVDIVPSQSVIFLRIWTHWISNNSWFPGSTAYGPTACRC